MPNMANITVKKADGITDVIYTVLAPAGPDGSKAVWRQDTAQPLNMPVGHRPIMEVRSVNNGPNTARRVEVTFKFPYSYDNTTTGRRETVDQCVGSATFTAPKEIPVSISDEAAHQFANACASALMKATFTSGYAPS